jgi:hypothetical protein
MKTEANIIMSLVVALPIMAQEKPTATAAPQKQRISYRVPASKAKYTQQHTIDIGDEPGHQIRISELHRTFSSPPTADQSKQGSGASSSAETPIFSGVRAIEQWSRSLSDYVDANGRTFGYAIFDMENGDKVYARYEGLAQTPTGGKTNFASVFTFTGGTGKFKELRGVMRATAAIAFAGGQAGAIDTQYDGEYWFEK